MDKRFIPSWFITELKRQIPLALPLIFMLLNSILFPMTAIVFVGRLGEVQLAGTGLAMTVVNFTQTGMAQGFTTGCDTLFSRAYGAGMKKKVGVYLQQSLLGICLFSMLCCAFFLIITPLLTGLRIDAEVAVITGNYLLFYTVGFFANVIYQILGKYLLLQGLMTVATVISILGNVINIAGHYLLIEHWRYGTIGSAISYSCTNLLMLAAILAFIRLSKVYEATWSGWTSDAFYEWGYFASFALPGMAMMCMEYLGFEIGAILAGMISATQVSAWTIFVQVNGMFCSIYTSFGQCISIRVGMSLGAGDITQARLAIKVAYILSLSSCLVCVCVSAVAAPTIAAVFTNSPDVISVASLMLRLALTYFIFNALESVQFGILRGCGRQTIGATVNLVAYFGIIIPLSIPLVFYTELEILGFVVSVAVGLALATIMLTIAIYNTNWTRQVDEAKKSSAEYGIGEAAALLRHASRPSNYSELDLTVIHKPRVDIHKQTSEPRLFVFVKRLATFLLCLSILALSIIYKINSGEASMERIFNLQTNYNFSVSLNDNSTALFAANVTTPKLLATETYRVHR